LPPAADAPQPSFEQALAELEQVVHDLEEGDLGLSESLARYEQGVKRLRECYAILERAERRIELLTAVDADGKPRTVPFDDTATFAADEKAPRRKKVKTASSPPPGTDGSDVDSTEGLF
jgi:exodeoxyribonuclease VII small subunit